MAKLIILVLITAGAVVFLLNQLKAFADTSPSYDPAAAIADEPALTIELDGVRDLADVLEPIRKEKKLPALAAAAVQDG